MRLNQTYCTLIAIVLLSCTLDFKGQNFSNIGTSLGINGYGGESEYGSGISFYDFDKDGWDDITVASDTILKFFKNTNGFFSEIIFEEFPPFQQLKSVLWADYDNDGDSDLLLTCNGHPNFLYQNNGEFLFTDVTLSAGLPQNNVNHFGASWSDYDRDGDLDLYITTYIFTTPMGQSDFDWYNHLYNNQGDGTFVDVSIESNVYDQIKLSFQGLWTDVNNDLWPDLFVINDKTNANSLYLNEADGTFTNIAVASGISNVNDDPMTATGGDFNNDGFEDLFTTNTLPKPCRLFTNNGNQLFTDVSSSAGVSINEFTWGANFLDADNDKDLDLYVSEYHGFFVDQTNYFFINEGNSVFAQDNFNSDTSNSYVNATGDYNNDGYPDIVVLNDEEQGVDFWSNGGGENNWIKINPEGVISNRDGIGTRIELWSNGTKQMRYTYCGESYLCQNSGSEIFGLTDAVTVDSLFLFWPSGHIDEYFNLEANNSYIMTEGGNVNATIYFEEDQYLCSGENISLYTGDFSSYLWNTGDTTEYILITEPGIYFVTVTNSLGFSGTSEHVQFFDGNFGEIQANVSDVSCFGANDGSIVFEGDTSQISSVILNDQSVGLLVTNLANGDYEYELTNDYGCTATGSLVISEPDSLFVWFDIQSVNCFGDSTGSIFTDTTNATEYEIVWNNEINADSLVNIPSGEYGYVLTNSDGCNISGSITIQQSPEILYEYILSHITCYGLADGSIAIEISGGTGTLDVVIDAPDPEALDEGIYEFTISDSLECSVGEEFEIIEPGQLLLTLSLEDWEPDFTYELFISGGTSPFQILWDTGDTTIWLYEEDCTVYHSVEVTDANGCSATTSIFCFGITNEDLHAVRLFPNPASDIVVIDGLDLKATTKIQLFDSKGSLVDNHLKIQPENNSLNVESLAHGLYTIQIQENDRTVILQFVKN